MHHLTLMNIKPANSIKNMNKVLFDGLATQSFSNAIYHGGGEYAKFILKIAIESGYSFDIVIANYLYCDQSIESLLVNHPNIKVIRIDKFKEIFDLIKVNNYEVFYSALPYRYSNYNYTAKFIGVIHGLRAIELPSDLYRYKYETSFYKKIGSILISNIPLIYKFIKNRHLRHSQKLLEIKDALFFTASYHTKYSILNHFPNLGNEDLKVFYSPFSVQSVMKYEQKENYYLMVSGGRFEKNIYRAVRVFDKLFSEGRLSD